MNSLVFKIKQLDNGTSANIKVYTMSISRTEILSFFNINSNQSQKELSSLKVKSISPKKINNYVSRVIDIAKKSTSSENKEKYGILKNHVSFVCNSEINRNLSDKAESIKDPKLIKLKKEIIENKTKEALHIETLMCSAPLQNYLTAMLDRDSKFKKLSKSERNEALKYAYDLLDKRIDDKIKSKNLKVTTIANAKELISIICNEEFNDTTKESKQSHKRSSVELSELNFDISMDDFSNDVMQGIDDIINRNRKM